MWGRINSLLWLGFRYKVFACRCQMFKLSTHSWYIHRAATQSSFFLNIESSTHTQTHFIRMLCIVPFASVIEQIVHRFTLSETFLHHINAHTHTHTILIQFLFSIFCFSLNFGNCFGFCCIFSLVTLFIENVKQKTFENWMHIGTAKRKQVFKREAK